MDKTIAIDFATAMVSERYGNNYACGFIGLAFPPPINNCDISMLKTDKILLYPGKEGQMKEALKCLRDNPKPSISRNIKKNTST
jgi:hypothetical protein